MTNTNVGLKNSVLHQVNVLKGLKLDEANGTRRDGLIQGTLTFLQNLNYVESTPEEIEDAKKYNSVEIPLKVKANLLKLNNYKLKTQHNLFGKLL